ncbi:nucleotidyltransferase [Rhodopirellula sp. JC639]|uniref:nucleotidyltransferase n=1 Tax=Stieleria mannarensis TaxID=2755585 RepID=UPI001601F66C|nr:nucleotidyltransferase [Rhodopirellula sp. JC639]
MQLPEDFKEFIELMNFHGVRYVMIGGYAYNLYRNPRATGDIDFFVACDDENERRVRAVLDQFGFGETLGEGKLLQLGKVIMLGRSPFRIDLLTEISGVSFEEVEATAIATQVSGVTIPVIAAELLLKNKAASDRIKDQADAEELRAWLNRD